MNSKSPAAGGALAVLGGDDRATFRILAALFFCSGATALVYEVIWTKLLTLAFGVSTFAVSAVLMAFMGGLAAGSFLFGRIIDRRRDPIRLYGLLELLIGLYACVLPWLLDQAGEAYVLLYRWWKPGFLAVSMVRLALSVAILLVPTVLMGGTLPIVSAVAARRGDRASRRTALLYGLNTLGAMVGCLATGFWLIPTLGLSVTTWLAAGVNAAIFAAAVLLDRAWRGAAEPRTVPAPCPAGEQSDAAPAHSSPRSRPRRLPAGDPAAPPVEHSDRVIAAVVLAAGLSGFAAMVYQTIWSRVLSMIVGTTVYAFCTIVATFLCGIVLGSVLYGLRPAKRPLLALGLAQFAIGVYVLLAMPWLDHLPFGFLRIFQWSGRNWALFQTLRFGLLFAAMLVPTVLFGLSFPLAVRIAVRRAEETGRRVGTVCGVNTLGAIAGSFAGGFVFVPLLGFQKGMLVTASGNILLGLALMAVNPRLRAATRGVLVTAGVGAFLAAVLLVTPWNIQYVNSGAYVYARDYSEVGDVARLKAALAAYTVHYYREGPTATVSVLSSPNGTLSLSIDGKTDASTGRNADMSTQVLLSHIPALFVDRPDDALMIGLGSGVSLGSLLKYRVQRVDAVEISQAVVEASRFFREYNYDALADPRVNLIVGDGRHHLRRTERTYDVIVSQPSNPWIAGVADLFTKEYYRLMNRRLKPGGVVCQWIPSYHMSKEMLAVVCKTFRNEFPHVSLWTSSVVGDLFLIGSKGPHEVNYRLFQERLTRPGIREDLGRIGMADPMMLASTFKFGSRGLDRFLAEFSPDLPENTDMDPVLEYMTPRFLLTQRVAKDFNSRSDLTGDHAQLLKLIRFTDPRNAQLFAQTLGVEGEPDPQHGVQ